MLMRYPASILHELALFGLVSPTCMAEAKKGEMEREKSVKRKREGERQLLEPG